MSPAVFGLTGEFGAEGFGATTLEGHLVLFTQPEFYAVAGLPAGLEAIEATAKQAAAYAEAVGLRGFVLNPGTHQRFVAGDAIRRLSNPLLAPEPPRIPTLRPWSDPEPPLVEAIVIAAENSSVESVWLAEGASVVTQPHPDPAFEAGLLARDIRLKSFGATPAWKPIFSRQTPEPSRVRLKELSGALPTSLREALVERAVATGLSELWTFEASLEGEDSSIGFAFSPHPCDEFVTKFDEIDTRFSLGGNSLLLDADTLREVLPRMGNRLL